MKNQIVTVRDARRERYEAEARMELKARDREVKRLEGLRKVAVRNGWSAMADRYAARIERERSRVI